MANVRDLKRDVKVMIKQFLQECYVQISFSPPLNMENVLDIISDALLLQQDTLRYLSNTPNRYTRHSQRDPGPFSREANVPRRGKGAKGCKEYFGSIASDFYDGIVELTERLNSLSY